MVSINFFIFLLNMQPGSGCTGSSCNWFNKRAIWRRCSSYKSETGSGSGLYCCRPRFSGWKVVSNPFFCLQPNFGFMYRFEPVLVPARVKIATWWRRYQRRPMLKRLPIRKPVALRFLAGKPGLPIWSWSARREARPAAGTGPATGLEHVGPWVRWSGRELVANIDVERLHWGSKFTK